MPHAPQWHNELHEAIMFEYNRMRNAGAEKGLSLHIFANISSYSGDDAGLKITYNIGDYGSSLKTEGADLHNVITEYMRRKNWNEANKPMVLIGNDSKTINAKPAPIVTDVKADDEIPF